MREQLQASLAASSASRVGDRAEEVSVPVRQSVQPVVVEAQSANNAFLEASQSSSARLDGMSNRVDAVQQGCQPMPVHGRNGAGASSLPSSGLPIPTKRFPSEPFGGDPGDDLEEENDDEEDLIQFGSPTAETEMVDSRTLKHANLYPTPNTAADYRNWKNSLIFLLGRLDISGSDYLTSWISHAFKVNTAEFCAGSSELVPRLDCGLASELIKGLKGVPDLQFKV